MYRMCRVHCSDYQRQRVIFGEYNHEFQVYQPEIRAYVMKNKRLDT